MAKEPEAQPEGAAATPPTIQLMGTYVKDLSFENFAMQKLMTLNTQPKFELNLNINNRKVQDDVYEVSIKVMVKANEGENTVFVLDLDYGGRFYIKDVQENALVPVLYIECPRILFPYVRQQVSSITADGGLLPLNMENIDFVKLFQNSVEQARQAQENSSN